MKSACHGAIVGRVLALLAFESADSREKGAPSIIQWDCKSRGAPAVSWRHWVAPRCVIARSDPAYDALLDFPVTLAVGTVDWSPESGAGMEAILAEADSLMYEDKRRSSGTA